jgi:hypothetical protein
MFEDDDETICANCGLVQCLCDVRQEHDCDDDDCDCGVDCSCCINGECNCHFED